MCRPPPGRYVEIAQAGERLKVFDAAPLPPNTPLVLINADRHRAAEPAPAQ